MNLRVPYKAGSFLTGWVTITSEEGLIFMESVSQAGRQAGRQSSGVLELCSVMEQGDAPSGAGCWVVSLCLSLSLSLSCST